MCPLETSCLTWKRHIYKRDLAPLVETLCKEKRRYWFGLSGGWYL
ncbi:rCG32016 [Rattus norvegicus]|uniref:RCG32016 n=1 Tax=Rattus norvegicus TaxID=10116 RepID=A6KDT1_RAT|nr:rCG32016 [Rattus norvegicus]